MQLVRLCKVPNIVESRQIHQHRVSLFQSGAHTPPAHVGLDLKYCPTLVRQELADPVQPQPPLHIGLALDHPIGGKPILQSNLIRLSEKRHVACEHRADHSLLKQRIRGFHFKHSAAPLIRTAVS